MAYPVAACTQCDTKNLHTTQLPAIFGSSNITTHNVPKVRNSILAVYCLIIHIAVVRISSGGSPSILKFTPLEYQYRSDRTIYSFTTVAKSAAAPAARSGKIITKLQRCKCLINSLLEVNIPMPFRSEIFCNRKFAYRRFSEKSLVDLVVHGVTRCGIIEQRY